MVCAECRFMMPVGGGLYICTNEQSENFNEYTGLCSEDDCPDGESDEY